jgi:hypothetical protein
VIFLGLSIAGLMTWLRQLGAANDQVEVPA